LVAQRSFELLGRYYSGVIVGIMRAMRQYGPWQSLNAGAVAGRPLHHTNHSSIIREQWGRRSRTACAGRESDI